MFHYFGYGLQIASEIEFPELKHSFSENADVQIVFDQAPKSIGGISFENNNRNYTINTNELLFEIKDTATFYALEGRLIKVDLHENNPGMQTVRMYILATVMSSLLLQRKAVPLHTSAIIQHYRLCLVTGDSGAGKSTTLAGLIKKGWAVFTDDVIVLKNQPDGIRASASYPMIKLWDDSIDSLQHRQFAHKSLAVMPGLDKYAFFFHNQFDKNSYRISTMVVLKKKPEGAITISPISGATVFKELTAQIYRPNLLQDKILFEITFHLFTELANTITAWVIERPEICLPEDLLEAVEKLIAHEKSN